MHAAMVSNLSTCQLCVLAAKVPLGVGPCPCPADGRAILDHADRGYCPRWLFGGQLLPANWELVPQVGEPAIQDAPQFTGGSCCDSPKAGDAT